MQIGYADQLLRLPRYSELGNAAMRPGLHGVARLLGAMGNPECNFKSVHIAGTNGKGSVASMIASIGQVAGYRIGLYTSPHLLHLSERIRLNGVPVSGTWMKGALDRYGSVFDRLQPSFFEAMTALSFLFFAESSVDIAVVETGLGGRFDATNILTPELSVITQIDLDHTRTLGNTLASITREKAGIIKKCTPVVAATGRASTQEIVQDTARSLNAPWIEVGYVTESCLHTPSHIHKLPSENHLSAPHQARNALLAVRSAELLFPETEHDPEIIQKGLSRVHELTGLRARLEILKQTPLTILDVAHNPSGVAAALDCIPNNGTLHLLLSLMRDKDLLGIVKVLRGYQLLRVYACDLELRRAYPAIELANVLRESAVKVAGVGSVSDMWNLAKDRASKEDTLFICGSHFLAETFLRGYI